MIDLTENILYEDSDVLVINKPSGLVVHPDGRTEEPSVSDWFAKKFPESKDVGEPMKLASGELVERAGVVHRIDRETSGALILAKTKAGHEAFKKQFQKREIEKIYHLFVYGNVKDDYGTVRLPIGRSASNFRKWSAERGARGDKREAVTDFKVLKRADDKSFTFLEAKPRTGRTHQIRVHFKALHHPVVSDKLYASTKPTLLGFSRLALHARAVSFKNVSGKLIKVEAPYPEDFKKAIENIK